MFSMRRFDWWKLHISLVYNPMAANKEKRFGYIFSVDHGYAVFGLRVKSYFFNLDWV